MPVFRTVRSGLSIELIWAACAKLDIVAVAPGRLVPQTFVKIVQPAESGVLREILVKQGDRVSAGQVLARLDATLNAADRLATGVKPPFSDCSCAGSTRSCRVDRS
jgi:HlyD family secretion protein